MFHFGRLVSNKLDVDLDLAKDVFNYLGPLITLVEKHLSHQVKRQSVCHQDELVAGRHVVHFCFEDGPI